MADNEERKATAPRGNEWEVVSLTSSAYAAAPGPQQVDSTQNSEVNLSGEDEVETSNAMFMSGHFLFPPSQHENLSVGSEYSEITSKKGSEDDISQSVEEDRVKSDGNDEDEGLKTEELPKTQTFDDKGNMLSVSDSVSGKDVAFDKEQDICSPTEFSSFHPEVIMGKSNTVEQGEGSDNPIEPPDHPLDSGLPNLQKSVDGEEYDKSDLPCEAWWKRRAVSLYAQAKDTNTFWSIFIAAAVMGLVIIGQRWQDFHLQGVFGTNNEKMGRILGTLSRFKDVIVGGHRRGSIVHGSASAER